MASHKNANRYVGGRFNATSTSATTLVSGVTADTAGICLSITFKNEGANRICLNFNKGSGFAGFGGSRTVPTCVNTNADYTNQVVLDTGVTKTFENFTCSDFAAVTAAATTSDLSWYALLCGV